MITRVSVEEAPETKSLKVPHKDARSFNNWDWFFLAFGICLTVAITLRSGAGRILWEDEVLGWMLLIDPSWRHMIFSWNHGADGGGFLFYLTGRAWFRLLGASTLSFRLYTSACFATAFVLLWSAARRFYQPLTVAFAFGVTWFLSPVLLPHMAEGRFYGLFLASTAAFILVILIASETAQPTWKFGVLTFASVSLLVTSHILGIVYSCCLLVVWVVIDHLQGVRNTPLYLAAVAAWSWLIPSRHAIAASAAVGRPHFWTAQPDLSEFLLTYTGKSLRTTVILLALIVLLMFQMRLRRFRHYARLSVTARRPIVLLATGLLLMPPMFYLEGMVGQAIYNERYLQPVEIGIAFAVAELFTLIRWPSITREPLRKQLLMLAAALLAVMVVEYDLFYLPAKQQLNYTVELTRSLPSGVPVVCEDAFAFTELMHMKANSSVNYEYMLDWPNSIDTKAPRLEVTEFHLMENWKKVGYFANHIEYRDEFVAHHPYFLVLETIEHEPDSLSHKGNDSGRQHMIGNPLTIRFSKEPTYVELPYFEQTEGNLRQIVTLVCNQSVDCSGVLSMLKKMTDGHRALNRPHDFEASSRKEKVGDGFQ